MAITLESMAAIAAPRITSSFASIRTAIHSFYVQLIIRFPRYNQGFTIVYLILNSCLKPSIFRNFAVETYSPHKRSLRMCTIPIYILNDKYLPAAYNIHMDKYPLHGYTILKREMENR